ncbi:MAG: acyl-CoA thioesterase [Ignavibacteria bacterium]
MLKRLSIFKHKCNVQVRTFDVDSQGIVHNAVYLQYFEIGRVEYRKSFGYRLLRNGFFEDGMKIVVVKNVIDYLSFAFLDDMLDIYSRIKWIKNSSFCFEQVMVNSETNQLIASALGVLVNLNPHTNVPQKLSEKFIKEVKNFEKRILIKR